MTHRARYIAIEGCIGVGKTTLTRILAEHFSARTVLEVVEENPFLPDFYRDSQAHAFKTQMFFLMSRFRQQESLVQGDLFDDFTVADYLFAKDRIFAELTLADAEMKLYTDMFEILNTRVAKPDLVIYLQAPLSVILQRIRQRGRSFERDIDPQYLSNLTASYARFFHDYDDTPLLIVDSSELNFPKRKSDVEKILSAVEQVREGTHALDASGFNKTNPQLMLGNLFNKPTQ